MSNVRATLNFSVDNGRPIDYYLYEPDPEVERNPPGTDPKEVEIRDGWPNAEKFSVDREGFEIKPFKTGFSDFDDDDRIKTAFYPDVVTFVKQQTGAKRALVFDHTIRRRLPDDLSQQTEVKRPAVQLVHGDYTTKSGPQRVRDILPNEAEDLLQGRVAFYNVWKPLFETVEELPLACCDAQSHAADDMLVMELKYRERTGEIYVMRHSADHRWWYFPRMTPEQALLLKTYDSATDGRARFMGHTAFEDPNTPPNALKRQSIEIRTMAFF
ncbi:MAG: CmcJ/NvfI family oxidoreductase [Geminicoccaceae bacterium]